MPLRNPGWITKAIVGCLGLFFLGWCAAAMAANPTVAVYQDTTFSKASDFNYAVGDWFENDPNNPLPWPENRTSEANGNTASVSLSAEPGFAGAAAAAIGVQYDWDMGSYSWDQVKDWKLSVTLNFTYELSADYVLGNGSANACLSFNVIPTTGSWYDLVGYEAGSPGSSGGTYSETFSTTFGEMPATVLAQVYCQAHSAYTTVHNSSASVTLNSITFHPDDDYSKYDFNYYYNDGSGDYYSGYVYAPTSFKITEDANNTGFIQVGTHLTNEPESLGSQALGGYYDITGITDGFDSSYDKQEYITSYYDGDTSNPSYTLYADSGESTAGNKSNPVTLFVADRTQAHESGYVYDPLVPATDAYFGNADVCYDFSPNSSEDNNFLVKYIPDLRYWAQPSNYSGSCAEVAAAIVLAYWDAQGYANLITTNWQTDWPDNTADTPSSYVSLIGDLAQAMNWNSTVGTYVVNIGPALEDYAQSANYSNPLYISYDILSNRSISWENFKAFMDNGYPVILRGERYADATIVGHVMVGRGYWNDHKILVDMGSGAGIANSIEDWNRTVAGLTYEEYCLTDMIYFHP